MLGGALVGITGIGCTLIVLPVLLLWFPHFIAPALAVKMTVATTLASTTVCVIFTAILHIKNRNVSYPLAAAMTAILLSLVLLLIAVKVVLKKRSQVNTFSKINPKVFTPVILIAGLANSICGIGTGNVSIPYLLQYYPQKVAAASSVISGVVACALGAIAYIIYGLDVPNLPKDSLGYVYLPAFFSLSIGIIIDTPLGFRINSKLNPLYIRYLLAILVGFAGVFTLIKTLTF